MRKRKRVVKVIFVVIVAVLIGSRPISTNFCIFINFMLY